jgi:ABC-type cobalamin/Fe3+-siderophores transport system ATPase subunit
VLDGEDGCGTSTLLRALHEQGGSCLLSQPPGDEWADGDVVADLLPPSGPALLELLGAQDLPLEREMWMLSGGQRQRVRLACALPGDAPVLLLDEPLGYLDGAGARALLGLLRERAAAGQAVVVVAKGDDRAAEAADRVLVLGHGRLTPAPDAP